MKRPANTWTHREKLVTSDLLLTTWNRRTYKLDEAQIFAENLTNKKKNQQVDEKPQVFENQISWQIIPDELPKVIEISNRFKTRQIEW